MSIDLSKFSADELASLTNLVKKTGSSNEQESLAAMSEFAQALELPLRDGVLVGDNVGDIFEKVSIGPGALPEWPVSFFRNDNASEFTAYTIPNHGKIPQRQIESDYVTIPTYDIGNSIDWPLKYAENARIDIIARALEVMEAGTQKKINDDAWHVIMAAGFDRNIVVNDSNASAGQFTKRLVSLLKLVMRRNGGGNATSMNRGTLTDLYVSPEALEDMRNWNIDEVDDITRREIYTSDVLEGARVFGVNIRPLDELGENQEYQQFYTQVIAAGAANDGMASGDVEIVIGLDQKNKDAFLMPVRKAWQVFEDPTLHRSRKAGFYGWAELGLGVLNSSRVLLGSL